MKKTALLIMALTILSKVFGFGRELILSYFYGASNISDAFLISITVPGTLFGFVAAGIIAGYIPIYSEIAQNESEIEANRFTNNLINISLVICSVIIMLGFTYTENIVKVFASGFEGETLLLAVRFTRISLFSMYFIAMVAILSGYLQIKNNYVIPALVGVPFNLIIMMSIILSKNFNILILTIGYVLATVTQVILMVPYVKKERYHYKFLLEAKNKHVIRMAYLAAPAIFGVSVNQINILVDRTIASRIEIGGISALNYANRLTGFILGIFVLSISTALYPIISKMAAENDLEKLKKILSESITGVNLIVLPSMIGSMLLAVPIVTVLFGRGAFDSDAIILTSSALFFYSIGMVAFGLRDILTRTFYSIQDSKTPMINAVIGMVLNIILNLILSRYLGIGGLALATSIAGIVTTSLLFISLRRKIGSFGVKQISISLLKIVCASLIMGMLAKISFNHLVHPLGQSLSLLIAIAIGVSTYFAIIIYMKIDDFDIIVDAIKSKLRT